MALLQVFGGTFGKANSPPSAKSTRVSRFGYCCLKTLAS